MNNMKWFEKHLSYKKGYYIKFKTILNYYKRNHQGSIVKTTYLKGIIGDLFEVTNKYVQDKKGKKSTHQNVVCAVLNDSIYDFVDK